ncbi:substrate-binding domain-containing protein [Micrococcales bacterium 31B]|nr:substrate-binding domain-containing protein [Micrococcales bacterium 31B]
METHVNRFPRAKRLLTALILVPALALAGCSATGGRRAAEASAAAVANAGTANTPRIKVALITHAAPGDTFWDYVRKGAEAGAAKDNVDLLYSSDPEASKQASLVQTAIDQKVDGIVVTLAKPEALKDVIGKARAANIPVMVINAGSAEWKEYGANAYFGSDEVVAGEAVGEQFNSLGVKKDLCVIQEQGHIGLEARCQGVKNKFSGETEILYVNGADDADVTSKITAKLQSDKTIDMVTALGAPYTLKAIEAGKSAGYTGKYSSFDMNADLGKLIQDGGLTLAVDQQPWLQGYLGVDAVWLYKNGGFEIGGGLPTLTGPTIIDQSNVAGVMAGAEQGVR